MAGSEVPRFVYTRVLLERDASLVFCAFNFDTLMAKVSFSAQYGLPAGAALLSDPLSYVVS